MPRWPVPRPARPSAVRLRRLTAPTEGARATSTVPLLRSPPGIHSRATYDTPGPQNQPSETVAYVLKGWPRISELFIASEIFRLEQAGTPLRLYVIKPPDETQAHPVVERIRATPEYLPPTTSLSATTLVAWLRENLSPFLPALRRTARRHPRGLARAGALAVAQSVRARKGRFAWPRKLYVKELLQAVALADRLAGAPDVRHLHAHFAHGTTTVTWLCSEITGLPFSFTGHAKDIYSPSLNPAGLLRRKLLAARFAVTCTEANARHLKAIAPEAVVHRVYHGLNADFSRLMGEERAAAAPGPNGKVRLLGVGRLVEKKGFDVVVDACGELDRRGVPFEAVIVGPDDDAGPGLRERISALGLEDRIRLQGQMSQDELYDEYRRASSGSTSRPLTPSCACARTTSWPRGSRPRRGRRSSASSTASGSRARYRRSSVRWSRERRTRARR